MKRALLIVASLGLVSCGPPPPPVYGGADPVGPNGCPSWVDTGQSGQYNEMMFLTAVGHGAAEGQCESDARAAMAKIFKAQVNQVTQEWQGYFSKASSLGAQFSAEVTNISSYTSVSTDKALDGLGVQIKARCPDNRGTQHCLAALEREPAAANLRSQIAQLDEQLKTKVSLGDAAGNDTQKFMQYAAAMELLAQRESLNIDLRIILARAATPPPIDFGALIAKFGGSRAKVKVGLKITGTEAARVQTCLAEGLTSKGLQVLESSSDVDVWIHGGLKYQKAGEVEGSVMVRADMNLRITDSSEGRTLAAFAEGVKVGRQDLQTSVQLAVFKLCEMANTALPQKIFDSFRR